MAQFRGNLDKSLILKSEGELGFVWVRFEKRLLNTTDKTVRVDHHVKCYRMAEWKAMQKGCLKHNLDFTKAAGYDDYEILHDPRLMKPEDIKTLEIK